MYFDVQSRLECASEQILHNKTLCVAGDIGGGRQLNPFRGLPSSLAPPSFTPNTFFLKQQHCPFMSYKSMHDGQQQKLIKIRTFFRQKYALFENFSWLVVSKVSHPRCFSNLNRIFYSLFTATLTSITDLILHKVRYVHTRLGIPNLNLYTE